MNQPQPRQSQILNPKDYMPEEQRLQDLNVPLFELE